MKKILIIILSISFFNAFSQGSYGEWEKKVEQVFFSFETPYYKIRVGKYISKIDAIKK